MYAATYVLLWLVLQGVVHYNVQVRGKSTGEAALYHMNMNNMRKVVSDGDFSFGCPQEE